MARFVRNPKVFIIDDLLTGVEVKGVEPKTKYQSDGEQDKRNGLPAWSVIVKVRTDVNDDEREPLKVTVGAAEMPAVTAKQIVRFAGVATGAMSGNPFVSAEHWGIVK